MTPTEQDKELMEKAHQLTDKLADQITTLENKYHHKEITLDKYIEMGEYYMKANTDEIMQLITADRKRVALEARIDERKKIALDYYRGKTISESTNWQAKFEYFIDSNERRIAELKAQQEEL